MSAQVKKSRKCSFFRLKLLYRLFVYLIKRMAKYEVLPKEDISKLCDMCIWFTVYFD